MKIYNSKILYIAHRIPYPPNKGDKIRSFNQIKYLSNFHEIDLVCLADNPDDLQFQDDLKKYCRYVFVLPFRSVVAMMKGFVNLLTGGTISTGYFYWKKMQAIVDQRLKNTKYDAIICFSSPMAEYILRSKNLHENHQRLIMDFCDVDSDKWFQYSRKSNFPMNLIYRIESKKLLKYEEKINKFFDYSIFISKNEADLFRKLVPKAKKIEIVANGVDYEYFTPKKSAPESAALVFAGAMDYDANVDGIIWFCKTIFPLIKIHCHDAKLYIAGSNPKTSVKNLAKNKDIVVTGFVEDIRHYYNLAEVCVIPLRLARGLQNKVLEAMSMKKAVVAASCAVQGIDEGCRKCLIVEDNPENFAKAVIILLKNESLRKELGKKARQFVKKRYDWQANMRNIKHLI